MRKINPAVLVLLGCMASPAYPDEAFDWKKVDQIFYRPAAVTGDVHRYAFPRGDLKVTLDGVALKPGLALGGWVAFAPIGDRSMMMGDLVLTEAEISPVMTKLLEQGVQVTAVHNHLLRAAPATYYMHVAGQGDPGKLAQAVRLALGESKTPLSVTPAAPPVPDDLSIATADIEKAIGFKGKINNGVYQFGIPRSDVIKENGMAIPGAMGTAIAINFQPTGGGKAVIAGDFVALAGEVNPLVRALRTNGIEVTAIHNHMLDDEPRAFFVHFWANDDAVRLALGLRSALDAVRVPPNG